MIAFILHFCQSKLIAPHAKCLCRKNYLFHCHQKVFFVFIDLFGSICNKSLGVLGV